MIAYSQKLDTDNEGFDRFSIQKHNFEMFLIKHLLNPKLY